jgi:hypothetical protein
MSRHTSSERKAFVVISREQTKIWTNLCDERAVPQTVYERNSIPKSFMQREFSPRQIQRNVVLKLTNRLDTQYAERIASRLEGVDKVFVVGRGSRRGALVNNFARMIKRNSSLESSSIHALQGIDPDGMKERELLAIARQIAA